MVLRVFCSEHPTKYPVMQRGAGSSLEPGCSLAYLGQQKGKICLEIRGETCLCGERGLASHLQPVGPF